ncbi:MAG: hypothetical protein AAB362_00220 [Patescibacteria group bacterium]
MDFQRHTIVTHVLSQLSDLYAQRLIEFCGTEERFPGISRGIEVLYTTDGGASLRDREGRFIVRGVELEGRSNVSFVGVGRGKYDEHGTGKVECEATLVARDLGLVRDQVSSDNFYGLERDGRVFKITSKDGKRSKTFIVSDPRLTHLLKAVAEDDIKGSRPFSLGSVVKTLHRAEYDANVVREIASAVFDAATKGPILKVERQDRYRDAVRLLVLELSAMRGSYHELATQRIERWLEKRRENMQFQPFDILDCIMLLVRDGVDAREWVRPILEAELQDQHWFHTESATEAKNARLTEVTLTVFDGFVSRCEKRVVAVIESDDERVHAYLMARDLGYYACCVVKKNGKGQVQVFPGSYEVTYDNGRKLKTDQKPFTHVMSYITAGVREAECNARGISCTADWTILTSDDGPKEERSWFFHRLTGWLMNGSLTAPDVPPTSLSLDKIAEIICEGMSNKYEDLRARAVENWKARK